MGKLVKMNTLINKLSDRPFKYGENDCFTFTNALVKEWHGKDFKKLHQYKNKKEAITYIRDNKGIEALITGTLGYSCAPEECADGDVVSAEVSADEVAVGFVFNGNGLFLGKTVVKIPLKKCRMGWRIK